MGEVIDDTLLISAPNILELNRIYGPCQQRFSRLQSEDLGSVVVTEVVEPNGGNEFNRSTRSQGAVVYRTVEADLDFCRSAG